jgi:acetate CoA/acetoacetate CoA-transferase beta subunit
MTHTAKGNAKLVASLAFPMTADRRVDLIVTEKAVIQPTEEGLLLKELGPGCTLDEVLSLTDSTLIIPDNLPHMQI